MEVRLEMNDEVKDEKMASLRDVIKSLVDLGALILAIGAFIVIDDIIFKPITAESAVYALIAFAILVLYGVIYSDTVKKILENNNTDRDHVLTRVIVIGMGTIYISRIIFLILEAWGEFSLGFNRVIELTVVFIGLYIAFERPREDGQEMRLREKVTKKVKPYGFPFLGTLFMVLGLTAFDESHLQSAMLFFSMSTLIWLHYSANLGTEAKKNNRYVGIVPDALSKIMILGFLYLLYAFSYTTYEVHNGVSSPAAALLSFNYTSVQVLAIMAASYALKVPFYWHEVKNTFK